MGELEQPRTGRLGNRRLEGAQAPAKERADAVELGVEENGVPVEAGSAVLDGLRPVRVIDLHPGAGEEQPALARTEDGDRRGHSLPPVST
jgi:hypothetical protein